MNNELPKVDITYGIKRKSDRNYKVFLFSIIPAVKGAYSVEVTTIDGNSFTSNVVKCNNRNGVIYSLIEGCFFVSWQK